MKAARHGASLAVLIGMILLGFVLGLAVLEIGLGRHGSAGVVLVSHDYEGDSDCYRYGDCRGGSGNEGEYRDDNRRGGISPGPFDRSPVDFRDNRVVICFPFSRCDAKDGEGDQPMFG